MIAEAGSNGMPYEIRDLTGQEFGELVVLELDGFDRRHHAMWKCSRSCGVIKVVRGSNMTARKHPTISCGHVRREMAKAAMTKWMNGRRGEEHPRFGKKWDTDPRHRPERRSGTGNPNYKHGLRCKNVLRRRHRDWQRQQRATERFL
jgi:hypothetical protein